MKTVDTRGHLCPTPLIMTKRAITQSSAGEVIEVISDNDTAKCNLLDYITELGYGADCESNGSEFRITFMISAPQGKSAEDLVTKRAVEQVDQTMFCTPAKSSKNGYAVVIKSESMGDGDNELGAMLMRACINSFAEVDHLPQTIVMYNSGVKLAVQGADTAQSLEKLKDKGVEIIVCGTCVDFYGVKELLAVGTISNMYKINTVLSQAEHIVYP